MRSDSLLLTRSEINSIDKPRLESKNLPLIGHHQFLCADPRQRAYGDAKLEPGRGSKSLKRQCKPVQETQVHYLRSC